MSRVTTPPQSQPTSMPAGATMQVPREKIAMRAYEKWQKRGCCDGCDMQDWTEAEAELRAEMMKSGGTSSTSGMGTRR
jgi:Protein of unknown function (DUF2934)